MRRRCRELRRSNYGMPEFGANWKLVAGWERIEWEGKGTENEYELKFKKNEYKKKLHATTGSGVRFDSVTASVLLAAS
jgi:hypothetical protein